MPEYLQQSETVAPGRAVVQHGISVGPLSALVAADGARRVGLATREGVSEAFDAVRHHPYSAGIEEMLRHADGRHESPGETRLAHALRLLGLAATPQARIPGSNAVVDFLVDEATVVIEFDGRVKYGRGADALDPFGRRREGRDVLWHEKQREDRLRELGYEIVRVTWSDLDSPQELAVRIRRAVVRSRRLTA